MSHNHSALTSLISDLLAEPDLAHEDVFRRMLQVGMQDLVDAEVTAKIGAGRYERTPERATRRNGTPAKRLATRKVGQLVRALGNDTGISRSTVSRICSEIDEAVHEFLGRRLDHTWFPYLFLDATYLDVRAHGRTDASAGTAALARKWPSSCRACRRSAILCTWTCGFTA